MGVKRIRGDEPAVVSVPPPTSGRAPRGSPAAAPPHVLRRDVSRGAVSARRCGSVPRIRLPDAVHHPAITAFLAG